MNLFSKKNDQITSMAKCDRLLKMGNESIEIDPMLLFQRFIIAAQSNPEADLPAIFSHELCSYPAALFDKASS